MNGPAPHSEKQTTTIASFSIRLTDEVVARPSIRMLRQTAEVSKAINSGAVSIGPTGLQCITAHQIKSKELETFGSVGHMRTHNVTEHIRLAAASRARARAPQRFEFEKRFRAVIPRDGQFISDLLNVTGLQTHLTDHLLSPRINTYETRTTVVVDLNFLSS
jgi:hypothetical protein